MKSFHLTKIEYMTPTGEGDIRLLGPNSTSILVPAEHWDIMIANMSEACDPRLTVVPMIATINSRHAGVIRFMSVQDEFIIDRIVSVERYNPTDENRNFLFDLAISMSAMFEEIMNDEDDEIDDI